MTGNLSGRLSGAEIDGLVAAVRDAARTQIMPRFRRLSPGDVAQKDGSGDLVTSADRAAERAIVAAVHRLMPDAAIVAEEAASEDPSVLDRLTAGGRVVLVDPLDGTWNFAAGLTLFGVMVAVVENGQTLFGMIHDPVLDDWVIGLRGGGAWYCRPGAAARRLQVPPPRPRSKAQAFVPVFMYPQVDRARILGQFAQWGRVNSLRCACHEYRSLAFGHADFMAAPSPKPWDHAAGVRVVQEAGGAAWGRGPGYDLTDCTTTLTVAAGPARGPDWHRAFR